MKYIQLSRLAIALGLITILLSSCSINTTNTTGFSGMDKIDDSSFIVVHDKLSFEVGNRIGVIHTAADQNYVLVTVELLDWKHKSGKSSDLEAVCNIPGRENEFLIVESGHWQGEYGRMFHIKLDVSRRPHSATVEGVFQIPEFNAKNPDDEEGDELEGVECAAKTDNQILVILGERGGTSVYPSGLIRWVVADLSTHEQTWPTAGRQGKQLNAPGTWVDSTTNRDISALYLDDKQVLWAAASEDPGDTGPFKSIVYKLAVVDASSDDPVHLLAPYSVRREFSGLKVEGLSWTYVSRGSQRVFD